MGKQAWQEGKSNGETSSANGLNLPSPTKIPGNSLLLIRLFLNSVVLVVLFDLLCDVQRQPMRVFQVRRRIRGPTPVECRCGCEDIPSNGHVTATSLQAPDSNNQYVDYKIIAK